MGSLANCLKIPYAHALPLHGTFGICSSSAGCNNKLQSSPLAHILRQTQLKWLGSQEEFKQNVSKAVQHFYFSTCTFIHFRTHLNHLVLCLHLCSIWFLLLPPSKNYVLLIETLLTEDGINQASHHRACLLSQQQCQKT